MCEKNENDYVLNYSETYCSSIFCVRMSSELLFLSFQDVGNLNPESHSNVKVQVFTEMSKTSQKSTICTTVVFSSGWKNLVSELYRPYRELRVSDSEFSPCCRSIRTTFTQREKWPGYFTLGRGLAPPANGIPQARLAAPRLTSAHPRGRAEGPEFLMKARGTRGPAPPRV